MLMPKARDVQSCACFVLAIAGRTSQNIRVKERMPVTRPNFSPVVYAASIVPLEDATLYGRAYARVPRERQKKADRYGNETVRRRSLAVAMLLHYGLQQAGLDATELAFAHNEEGKPYLAGETLCFNLSHSGEWAVCAIAGGEVGCDVEKVTQCKLGVAERFFCREEYDDIAAQPLGEAQADRFFRYWTLKESFMKATGLGMKLGFDTFRIELGDSICVRHTVNEQTYSFCEFADLPGYKCALCVAGERADATLHMVDLKDIL